MFPENIDNASQREILTLDLFEVMPLLQAKLDHRSIFDQNINVTNSTPLDEC